MPIKSSQHKKDALNETIYESIAPRLLSKADRRKLEILDAAIQTYSSLNIDYVSYEDIARAAKISRPLLGHHYPEKRELFETSMKFIRARFQERAVKAISRCESPADQLIAYIKSTLSWLSEARSDARAWVFFFYICMEDKKLRHLHMNLTDMGMQRLISLLESGKSKKVFQFLDSVILAKNIQRIITGALLEAATEHEAGDSAIKKIENQTIDLCLLLVGYQAIG